MSEIHNPDRTGSTPPGTFIPLTWDNTQIWTGNGVTWEDVDGGVGPAVLVLRVVGQANGGFTSIVYARKHGVTVAGVGGNAIQSNHGNGADFVGYIIVPTDPAGHIDIKCAVQMASATVYRLAYWRAPMPRNVFAGAASPGAYADLNLGVKNALCVLRLSTTRVAARDVSFRVKADATAQQGYGYDVASLSSFSSAIDAYVVIPTDSDGLVSWYTPVQDDYTLTLEAYMPIVDVQSDVIFATAAIPAAWQDLVTIFGRSILFVKGVGSADGAVHARENGEALDGSDQNGMGFVPVQNNKHGYGLWIMDYAGTNEWEKAGAGVNITVTKQARLT